MINRPNPHDSMLDGFNISVCERAKNSITNFSNILNACANESTLADDCSEANKQDFGNSAKTFCKKYSAHFIISLLNINSLKNKFSDISFLLNQQQVDILVINETKLNDLIDDSIFENVFYQMIRRDRPDSGGGGILVFIKKSIKQLIHNNSSRPHYIIQINAKFNFIIHVYSQSLQGQCVKS